MEDFGNEKNFHKDGASNLDTLRVRKFLAKKSITKMDHPPYSPDLAPCDFWLFPK
jgi:histone-lysine N-methyltransferase SETMAR